jgi:two-component system chemotaxis response regulator CheY
VLLPLVANASQSDVMPDGSAVITTLIVDDERDVRTLVRLVVEAADNGLQVVGEAADGTEALDRWHEHRPTVVVLDNRMPGLTGLQVAERILAESAEQQIILFSAYIDDEIIGEARRVGIRRVLDKTQIDRLPQELWAMAEPA